MTTMADHRRKKANLQPQYVMTCIMTGCDNHSICEMRVFLPPFFLHKDTGWHAPRVQGGGRGQPRRRRRRADPQMTHSGPTAPPRWCPIAGVIAAVSAGRSYHRAPAPPARVHRPGAAGGGGVTAQKEGSQQ